MSADVTLMPTMSQQRRSFFIVLLAVCAVFGAGVFIGFRSAPPPALPEHVHRPGEEPIPLPTFALRDANGHTFDNARLRGKWSVLFFGYIQCPDVCPTTLHTLKQFVTQLASAGTDPPQVVFISLDPQRDTPELLNDFIRYFHPDFIAATGTLAELRQFALPISGPFDYEDTETGEPIRDLSTLPAGKRYHLHHSGSLYLVTPDGDLAAYMLPPHSVDKLRITYDILRKSNDRWF